MKKSLWIVLLIALIVGLIPTPTYAQSLVDSDIVDQKNLNGFDWFYKTEPVTAQRKSFYALGYYWAFHSEGQSIYYNSSTDGDTWGATTVVTVSALNISNNAVQWAVATDGTYLHIALQPTTYQIVYKRIQLNSNGTLSYPTAEYEAINTSPFTCGNPSIGVDTDGYPFIAMSAYNLGNNEMRVVTTDDAVSPFNGVWSTESGYPYTLNSSGAGWISAVVPLSTGKMAVVYTKYTGSAYTVRLRKYNGTGTDWSAERVTTGECQSGQFSVVSLADNAHIVFTTKTTYDITYVIYDGTTNTMGAESVLYAGTTATLSGIISKDNLNNFHVYWVNEPVADHIYYARYVALEATWYGDYTIVNEAVLDGLPATSYSLNADEAPNLAPKDMGIYYVADAQRLKFKRLGEQFIVDTLTPTGVGAEQATLEGEILSIGWGSPLERGFYINTSESLVGAAHYSETDPGGYGTGAFSRTIGGLTPETTYHYIAYADNAETAWGTWVSFTTLAEGVIPTPPPGNCTIAPVITTTAATYISMTSARLNALVNNAGCWDCTCSVYFQWYKAGGAWGDNQNFPVSGYHTGDTPYLNIASLDGNSTYYFRAIASNNCGNTTGNTMSFTTLVALENVTDFLAIPRANEPTIDLTWQKPVGATEVLIRYKLGEYPGNSTDGIFVCQESTTNGFAHEELTAGNTLYYSAWGVSGNFTSTTAAHAIATVSLATSPTAPAAPDMPSNWFTGVQYTQMSGMPFYDVINTVSDAFGLNRQFFWASLGFLIALLVFIAAYRATQARVMVALIAATVVMGIETKMGLMAGFMILVLLLLSISAWAVERR